MKQKQLKSLQQIFENNRNQGTAIHMKKYMRDQFPFIGLKAKERRELSKTFIKEVTFDEKIECFIKRLWKRQESEYQYVAIDY